MRLVTILACVAVLILGFAAPASTQPVIPPPGYFASENAGFLCLQIPVPGLGPVFVLVQMNFDPVTGGGISLAQADALFAQVGLGLAGGGLGTPLCSFTPSQLRNGGLNALQVTNIVLPQWIPLGWDLYFILDVFKSTSTLSYLPNLGTMAIVRGDVFTAVGGNGLSFEGAAEVLRSTLGL